MHALYARHTAFYAYQSIPELCEYMYQYVMYCMSWMEYEPPLEGEVSGSSATAGPHARQALITCRLCVYLSQRCSQSPIRQELNIFNISIEGIQM